MIKALANKAVQHFICYSLGEKSLQVTSPSMLRVPQFSRSGVHGLHGNNGPVSGGHWSNIGLEIEGDHHSLSWSKHFMVRFGSAAMILPCKGEGPVMMVHSQRLMEPDGFLTVLWDFPDDRAGDLVEQ